MMTSDGNLNPPVAHKMVWGTLIAAITVGTIFTESVPVAKAMAIAGALPFSVILLVQIVGFLREIRKERRRPRPIERSEEHTSELQSLMRISYAVFCLKKKKLNNNNL